MAKHIVKCKYCGESFDASVIEYKQIGNRYAHIPCFEGAEKIRLQKEEEQAKKDADKNALYDYINKLFDGKQNYAWINKNIQKYIKDYNYNYKGILKTLVYCYEIKHFSIEKANGGIGIVPYYYNEAFNYYQVLSLAKMRNEDKNFDEYKLNTTEIHIKNPERKPMKKKKLFSFLDEEGE